MIVHPVLRALRRDDSPQRDAQEQLHRSITRWRETPRIAEVFADIESFAEGRPIAECSALAALFDGSNPAASELALGFASGTAAALSRLPLGHVRLRHFTDGVLSTLLLARSGNVTLTLVALDGDGLRAKPAPVTVDFSPSEMWEHVLAGSAHAELIERCSSDANGAKLGRQAVDLGSGRVVRRDAERQALHIREVAGCLVSLRLQRRRMLAGVTCEYRLDDGKLVHQAAGNPRDSRLELMMALLGRMGRTDAAPQLAEIARERGSDALRWQALREALALDTLTGFRTLTEIAGSEDDGLAPAAAALHAQLIKAHPQLGEIDLCPA
ncbi:MAG: hypothetical protein R3E09_03780 [Novosphingobium sp.]|nr:hypothetical protein [Novosphingobium sp.]